MAGPNVLQNRCYMCIQWTCVLYSVVITRQSNPSISQFNSPRNEFMSVGLMYYIQYHMLSVFPGIILLQYFMVSKLASQYWSKYWGGLLGNKAKLWAYSKGNSWFIIIWKQMSLYYINPGLPIPPTYMISVPPSHLQKKQK